MPKRPRFFQRVDTQDIIESVKTHGVKTPIIVRGNKNGTYTIVDGVRRFYAARKANQKTIPCRVISPTT